MAWYDNAVFYHIYPLGLCGCAHENDGQPTPGARVLDEQFFKPFHLFVVETAAKVGQIFRIAAFLPNEKCSEYGREYHSVLSDYDNLAAS